MKTGSLSIFPKARARIEAALRYGVCAAASCLEGAGCSDSIRPLKECLKMETQFGTQDFA
jgi:hypothetical protein